MFGTKSFKTLVAAGALAVASLGSAQDANASTVVDSVGDSFAVNFEYEELKAVLTWTVTNILNNTWSFSVLIDNQSVALPTANSNRIVSFGFATDPNATNLAISTAGWGGSTTNLAPHSPTFAIEACVFAGNNCAGGGNNGVFAGLMQTVNLSFNAGPAPLTFTEFTTRWQSIDVTGPDGRPAGSIVIGPTPIPVPAAGFLLIGALGGLAALSRRRRAA
jgi:hypothetical protein